MIPSIGAWSSVQDAMAAVELSKDRGVVVVGNDKRVLGVVTEGDIVRALRQGVLLEAHVSQIMQISPRLSLRELTAREFADEFVLKGTLMIPIVDKNRHLIVVQRARDAVKVLLDESVQ